MEEKIENIRYNPDCKTGLTKEQIDERIKNNLVNCDMTAKTKSIKAIICSNFFTVFNLINVLLALAIFSVKSYKNMLFLWLVISTIHFSLSKRTIAKLSVISESKVLVRRDGKEQNIGINEVVLDDIVLFQAGNQIVNDCIVCEGEVEVNEAYITGESDARFKKKGDMLLSGSYIVSGRCTRKGRTYWRRKLYL